MDPIAALKEFLEALAAGDRTTAIERGQDLTEWFEKGGFLPTVEPIAGSGTASGHRAWVIR